MKNILDIPKPVESNQRLIDCINSSFANMQKTTKAINNIYDSSGFANLQRVAALSMKNDVAISSIRNIQNNFNSIQVMSNQIVETYKNSVRFMEPIINIGNMLKDSYISMASTYKYTEDLANVCSAIINQMPKLDKTISALEIIRSDFSRINFEEYLNLYNSIEMQISKLSEDEINSALESTVDWTDVQLDENSISYEDSTGSVVEKPKFKVIKKILLCIIYPLIVHILGSTFDHVVFGDPVTEVVNNNAKIIQNIEGEQIYFNYFMAEEMYSGLENTLSVGEETIKPRVKPDCSSKVVGTLEPGRIVYPLNKNKKWIQILWKDESGTKYSGWIQNWKLNTTD